MNSSNFQKYEMGSASKIAKHDFIQPDALAKGRGKSLGVMSSLRITVEQRILIVKNNSCNTATSTLSKLTEKNVLMHPRFDEMKENVPLYKEVEVMQDAQRSDARGRGKNLVMGSLKVNAEKSTSIGNNRSCTAANFNLNEPAKKSILLPPSFHLIEDNDTLYQEAEVTSDAQRSPCESEKGKKVRGLNIYKNEMRLKPGEKLKVTFHQNRAIGPNHASFSRHLGLLVRDHNMCPLRVHSWLDIEEHKFEHMWKVVMVEIQELVQSKPSLTNIEVVERCFRPQCKSHAIGFGGGITAKELKGGTTSKAALLEELKATRKEKESLQESEDFLESKYEQLESLVVRWPSSPPPDQEFEV